MKTLCLAASLAFAPMLTGAAFAADDFAVRSSNFQLGISSQHVATSGSISNGALGADFDANFPLVSYLGGSVSGSFARSEARVRSALESADNGTSGTLTQPCSFNNTTYGASLFLRKPSLGRVGVSYDRGKLDADCGDDSQFLSTLGDSLTTKNLTGFVEYYWRDFTFAGQHVETTLERGAKLKSDTFSISWYPLNSLRVGLSTNDLYGNRSYGVMIEHQPEFLGDAFSVSLGYAIRDQDPQVRTVTFNLVYHFGTQVELKTRDREYR